MIHIVWDNQNTFFKKTNTFQATTFKVEENSRTSLKIHRSVASIYAYKHMCTAKVWNFLYYFLKAFLSLNQDD